MMLRWIWLEPAKIVTARPKRNVCWRPSVPKIGSSLDEHPMRRAPASRAHRSAGTTATSTASRSTSRARWTRSSSAASVRWAVKRMMRTSLHDRARSSRIVGSSIVPLSRARRDQIVELLGERELHPERADAPLEAERAHRDPPAVSRPHPRPGRPRVRAPSRNSSLNSSPAGGLTDRTARGSRAGPSGPAGS